MIKPGDLFTIAGVYEPDRRRLPRLLAWIMRKTGPVLGLRRFRAGKVVTGTTGIWQPLDHDKSKGS